jgi:hypothetical protein
MSSSTLRGRKVTVELLPKIPDQAAIAGLVRSWWAVVGRFARGVLRLRGLREWISRAGRATAARLARTIRRLARCLPSTRRCRRAAPPA